MLFYNFNVQKSIVSNVKRAGTKLVPARTTAGGLGLVASAATSATVGPAAATPGIGAGVAVAGVRGVRVAAVVRSVTVVTNIDARTVLDATVPVDEHLVVRPVPVVIDTDAAAVHVRRHRGK